MLNPQMFQHSTAPLLHIYLTVSSSSIDTRATASKNRGLDARQCKHEHLEPSHC